MPDRALDVVCPERFGAGLSARSATERLAATCNFLRGRATRQYGIGETAGHRVTPRRTLAPHKPDVTTLETARSPYFRTEERVKSAPEPVFRPPVDCCQAGQSQPMSPYRGTRPLRGPGNGPHSETDKGRRPLRAPNPVAGKGPEPRTPTRAGTKAGPGKLPSPNPRKFRHYFLKRLQKRVAFRIERLLLRRGRAPRPSKILAPSQAVEQRGIGCRR